MNISSESLIEQAREKSGLHGFFSDSFRDGLELLTQGYEKTNVLTDEGRKLFHGKSISLLAHRLRVDDWLDKNQKVLDASVTRPVFIVGMPRTGTTLLFNLLATDEKFRCLMRWEADDLIPPEGASYENDPRIERRKEAQGQAKVTPHFEQFQDPAECYHIIAQDFRCISLDHPVDNPPYREWLYNTDKTSAYQHHKRVLQMLQSYKSGRWLLKLPSHVLNLNEIIKVYPDAMFITLHRDPVVATASYVSLTYHSLTSRTHKILDTKAMGRQLIPQLYKHASAMMEFREKNPDVPFLDLHYKELKRNPIEVIQKIYDFSGESLESNAIDVMNNYTANNPQQPFGKHSYKLEDFTDNANDVFEKYNDYRSQYDIAEG